MWSPLDDGFYSHPKILQLSVDLDAIGLWTLCLSWASRYLTDGKLPHGLPYRLSALPPAQLDRLAARLIEVGLWERAEAGGYQIHDYGDWALCRAEVLRRQALARARKARWAEHRATRSERVPPRVPNADGTVPSPILSSPILSSTSPTLSSTSPRPRERKPPAAGGRQRARLPDEFESFWRAYPKHEAKEAARKVWARLQPDAALVGRMLEAITMQRASRNWREGFIPQPARWLTGKRWTDEISPTTTLPAHTQATLQATAGFVEHMKGLQP
jgi:hypothetical protein